MDDQNRRRRGSAQQGYTNSSRSVSALSDRLRQQPLLATRDSTSISSAASGGSSSRYSYYTENSPLSAPSIPNSSFQYQSGYPPEQQRTQALSGYEPNMIFNEGPQSQATLYNNLPHQYVQAQYQSPHRYTGGIGGLPESMGDVPQSYVPRELPSASAAPLAPPGNSSQYAPLSYASQNLTSRNDLAPSYSPGMSDLPQPTSASDSLQEHDPESRCEDVYEDYQRELARTFERIHEVRLAEAGPLLLQLSNWLVSHVADLGLTEDDQSRYEERLKLWNDFNTCWLAVLQKQKDVTQALLQSGQRLASSQSLLQKASLEQMAAELIRLCDGLERHGLVDYEMGVWEERIIELLVPCLDLIEGENEPTFIELTTDTRGPPVGDAPYPPARASRLP